jgi:CBS domain-containing protein
MLVDNAMSSNVHSCHPTNNLEEVARIMWQNNCGAVPVVDHTDKPIGIITDRDIAMTSMLNHKPLWDLSVKDLINQQSLSFCQLGDKLEHCLELMEKKSIRRLPVINDTGYLAGMLSMGDIIAFATNKKTKNKQSNFVSFDDVMAMLKHVSAHHEEPDLPVPAD